MFLAMNELFATTYGEYQIPSCSTMTDSILCYKYFVEPIITSRRLNKSS